MGSRKKGMIAGSIAVIIAAIGAVCMWLKREDY